MHYYQFNIGDYKSHTDHLDPLEDIAYRRMIDWLYLHEKPLPDDVNQIARLINMRSHSDCIAIVMQEFFETTSEGLINKRVSLEIDAFHSKGEKARASAKARWDKVKALKGKGNDANALRAQSEGNANHKPITNNHKPITKEKKGGKPRFSPPTLEEVKQEVSEKLYRVDPEAFFFHYEGNGWMVGKNKMKNWRMALASWNKREGQNQKQKGTGFNRLMELAQ